MSKQTNFAWAIWLALALPAVAEGPDAATVVAKVNGTEITLGHMIAARGTLPPQYLTMADDVLFNGILDQIIQQTALAQVGEADITKRDELVMANERRAYLAASVLDETALAALTEPALQKAYDARFASAEPSKEYNAGHVLLDTEEAAKAVKARIDGGEDFTALAKELSTGPSGPNGGELGWFGAGQTVKAFEDAVVAMEPGQISDPVQTDIGWHIIRLNETRLSEAPDLESVREELETEIQTRAVEARLAELTAAAKVERMVDGLDVALIKNDALLDQ